MDQQSSERARRAAAARRLVKGACRVCGTPTVGTRKRRYCSARCRDRAYRGRQRALRLAPTPENAAALLEGLALAHPDVVSSFFGRMMAERPRPVYKGTCLQCGGPFEGSIRQKYCSRRCTNAASYAARKERGGLTVGQELHRWLVDRVDRWGPVPKRQQKRWQRFVESKW
jgi:predicted nucleic acid-binding Zn ribbon protein